MSEKRSSLYYILIVVIGGLIGTVFGEIFGRIAPAQGWLHNFFTASVNPGIPVSSPQPIDLVVLKLAIGFEIKITIMTVVGIILASLLMRKL